MTWISSVDKREWGVRGRWGATTEAKVPCETRVLQIRRVIRKNEETQFPRLMHPIYWKREELKEKNKIEEAERKGRAH